MSIFSKEKKAKGRPPSEDPGQQITTYVLKRHIQEAKNKNMLMAHLIKKSIDRWIEEGRPDFLD